MSSHALVPIASWLGTSVSCKYVYVCDNMIYILIIIMCIDLCVSFASDVTSSCSFLTFEDLTVSDLQRLHSCEYVCLFTVLKNI